MSHSTSLKQKEQSSGQDSTKEADKEPYLNEEIKSAEPLRVVGNNTQGYCITLGKYRISEIHDHPTKAIQSLETNPWPTIINIIGAIIQDLPNWKDELK